MSRGKIEQKMLELEEAVEEVTGEKPTIAVNIRLADMDSKREFYKQAKRISNAVTLDNQKIRRHEYWSHKGTCGIRLFKAGFNDIKNRKYFRRHTLDVLW